MCVRLCVQAVLFVRYKNTLSTIFITIWPRSITE